MIFFLYGPDTFRSRQKLKILKEKFLKEVDPTGYSLFELKGAKINFTDLKQTLNTNSFLTRKRLVVVEEFLSKKRENENEIIAFLKANVQDEANILIFWETDSGEANPKLFKFLNNQKQVEEFKKLKNIELVKWVNGKFKGNDIRISRDFAEQLLDLIGNDLWQVDRETDKLIAYYAADKDIVGQDWKELLAANFNESIFQLTDAVAEKKKALALKLVNGHLNSGINEGYLLAMLTRQFRIMLQIKNLMASGYDLPRVTAKLNYHPYVIKKTWSQSAKYSWADLKGLYQQLLAIDNSLKSGGKNFKTWLNLLIFSN